MKYYVLCLMMIISTSIDSFNRNTGTVGTVVARLQTSPAIMRSTELRAATLKMYSEPLLTAGKKIALAGEKILALTKEREADYWGGGLSLCGANIRNAGDSIAQAGASCKNKWGKELVVDEMRESAVCLKEAAEMIRKHQLVGGEEDVLKTMNGSTIATVLGEFGEVTEEVAFAFLTGRGGGLVEEFEKGSDCLSRLGDLFAEVKGLEEAAALFRQSRNIFEKIKLLE